MDYAKGTHKGFAFVEYNDADDAKEAIYNLDGSELFGRVLTIGLAQSNQMNLNSNKAVWSNDEFFQQTMSGANAGDAEQKKNDAIDGATLQEDGQAKR